MELHGKMHALRVKIKTSRGHVPNSYYVELAIFITLVRMRVLCTYASCVVSVHTPIDASFGALHVGHTLTRTQEASAPEDRSDTMSSS